MFMYCKLHFNLHISFCMHISIKSFLREITKEILFYPQHYHILIRPLYCVNGNSTPATYPHHISVHSCVGRQQDRRDHWTEEGVLEDRRGPLDRGRGGA